MANVCISHFEVSDNCASLQMSPRNRLDETEHLLKKSYKFHLSQGMHYCRRKMTALYLRSTSKGEGSSGYRDSPTLEECTLAMAPRGKSQKRLNSEMAQAFGPFAQQVANSDSVSLLRIHMADDLKAINQCPKFHLPMSPFAQFS